MTAITYHHSPDLPWTDDPRDERRFRRIAAAAIFLFFLFSIILPMIDVPKIERPKNQPIPERVAKMVLEHKKLQQPPPPPAALPDQPPDPSKAKAPVAEKKVEPVKEEPPPPPKVELKVKPEPEPVAEIKPDLEAIARMEQQRREAEIAAARKKAATTGLLALSNDLAAIRDKPVVSNTIGNEKLTGSGPSRKEAVVQRAMITSGVAATKGANIGINTSNLSKGVSSAGLSERATTRVNAPSALAAASEPAGKLANTTKAPGQKASRTDAEIQLVFDKNKNALYSLYNRALRQDPTLQGKVVLKITIDPSGGVISCEVVSSEMSAPELIQKIVARVLLFDFGSKDVAVTVTTFPIEFLPTS